MLGRHQGVHPPSLPPSVPPLKSCRPPPAVRPSVASHSFVCRLSPQPLLSIDETPLTRRGAVAVVGDLATAGATEVGHAAGALGEEQRLARCGVPRCLRCRKGDEHGVDALGDGVTATTPSTLLYGALTPSEWQASPRLEHRRAVVDEAHQRQRRGTPVTGLEDLTGPLRFEAPMPPSCFIFVVTRSLHPIEVAIPCHRVTLEFGEYVPCSTLLCSIFKWLFEL
jgi:hypothetical protein